jgi:hypothetical protein
MSGTGIFEFDYDAWSALFPELAPSISDVQATLYFGIAETVVDNSACSVIPIAPRGTILNLTTAHIAKLFGSIDGQPPTPLVGRISNASEGSVSVQVEFEATQSAQWWVQTSYGALAWQAQAPYRMALYAAPRQVPRSFQSYPGAGLPGFGGPVFFRGIRR